MKNMIVPLNTFPLVVTLPNGTFYPLPDKISEIPSLINWLERSALVTALGKYTIAFLADDEFDLPLISVTFYGDSTWGISLIEQAEDSPFKNAILTTDDFLMFINHLASKAPSSARAVFLGATTDDRPPFGYNGEQGLALYFIGSDDEVLATLDFYWKARKRTGVSIPWQLPYFEGNIQQAMDESIIVPTINEAIAIVEGIRSQLNVPLKLAFDMAWKV